MNTTALPGTPSHLLTREDAEAILAPYVERLNRCIQHGWDAWKRDYATKHHILSARARATIVFDEIIACALDEFPESDQIRTRRTSSSFMLYFGDSILLRFKKLRPDGRCSNIRTNQQDLFRAQLQYTLPGMNPVTLVHAGYLLDEAGVDITRKSVVCQFEKKVVWQLPLSNAIDHVETMPETSQSGEVPRRFTAKPELVPAKAVEAGKKVDSEE